MRRLSSLFRRRRLRARKLCFIHIPKCGGNSIKDAFRRFAYRKKEIFILESRGSSQAADFLSEDLWEFRQRLLVYSLCCRKYRFVAGHFTCNKEILEAFRSEWDFITILRDPIERWLSNYFFDRHKEDPHFHTDLSIDEYMASDIGRLKGAEYVRFLTGVHDLERLHTRELIDDAIDCLGGFDVIGLLEHLDDFSARFENRYRTPLALRKLNPNPVGPEEMEGQVTPEIRRRLREVCMPDIALHESVARKLSPSA
jgi:hypothetical protein